MSLYEDLLWNKLHKNMAYSTAIDTHDMRIACVRSKGVVRPVVSKHL